jgi:putative DNA primase/helicase|uniref:toprim domain-containing protein n=1 Tax=Orrella sp. TaxID=1921583 RepID=UPI004048798A
MIENILSRLHKVRQSGNSWTALCPAHEDKQPSLSISTGAQGVLLKCFAGCETSAVVDALGLRMRDLFHTDRHPLKPARTPFKAPVEPPISLGLQPCAQRLWDDSKPLSGVALNYLESRRCAIPPADGDLRWHQAIKHPSGYVGAALIGLVTHVETNEPMSLHRTWITPTGKAGLDKARMLAYGHTAKNGVIRLYPDDAVTTGLGVAEGIETALSLAHEHEPVWAAISATNMANLPVLDGIESIVIAVDEDIAGRNAANMLAHRWLDANRQVTAITFENGDANDHVEVAYA